MKEKLKSLTVILNPISIYGFGSTFFIANNKSDVDLFIISNFFEGMSRMKRREIVQSLFFGADPICHTLSELNQIEFQAGIYMEITQKGVLLYGSKIN